MKSLLDIFFASLLFILLIPFLGLVALVIFLADFNSPFFTQKRLGLNQTEFNIIKFRSMRNGKITFVGRLIRKTGIDELPQLLNIILLQMSFVGPRPLTQGDIERLNWTAPYYKQRWRVKPGLVGLAQLSPMCNKKMSWFLDLSYIKRRSLFLDMKIISWSSMIPFFGKKKVIQWVHK